MPLAALPVVAPLALAVAAPTGAFFLEPLLLRGLHVRHVLAVLPKNAAPVHLTPETLECTINVFVVSNLNTNSQRESLLEESGFGM